MLKMPEGKCKIKIKEPDVQHSHLDIPLVW